MCIFSKQKPWPDQIQQFGPGTKQQKCLGQTNHKNHGLVGRDTMMRSWLWMWLSKALSEVDSDHAKHLQKRTQGVTKLTKMATRFSRLPDHSESMSVLSQFVDWFRSLFAKLQENYSSSNIINSRERTKRKVCVLLTARAFACQSGHAWCWWCALVWPIDTWSES